MSWLNSAAVNIGVHVSFWIRVFVFSTFFDWEFGSHFNALPKFPTCSMMFNHQGVYSLCMKSEVGSSLMAMLLFGLSWVVNTGHMYLAVGGWAGHRNIKSAVVKCIILQHTFHGASLTTSEFCVLDVWLSSLLAVVNIKWHNTRENTVSHKVLHKCSGYKVSICAVF